MNAARLTVCLVASVPAAWLAAALYERIPSGLPLLRPFPRPWPPTRLHVTVQVLTTALFAVAAWRFQEAVVGVLVAYLVFFTVAVALSVIDIDTLRLPDPIVAGALVVSVPLITAVSLMEDAAESIRFALVGAAVYFGFLLVTHLAFPRGMGFGDVKAAALLGLFLGWPATSGITAAMLVLYAMLAGFLVGSVAGIVLFAFRGRSVSYPFGPFLIGGAVLVIVFSDHLLPPVA